MAVAAQHRPSSLSWLWPALAAVFAGVAAWALLRPRPEAPVSRFLVDFPEGQEIHVLGWPSYTLAPDGSWLVYTGPEPNGTREQFWIKRRGELDATPLGGTINAWAPTASPDGQWIAFLGGANELRTVPIVGGAPTTLADSVINTNTASPTWGDDGVISYVHRSGSIHRIPASGGTPSVAWAAPNGTQAGFLTSLPDGRGLLFQLCSNRCRTGTEVRVLDLRTDSAWTMVPGALRAWYADGKVIYVRQDGGVFAQPFDLDKLSLGGSPIPLLEEIGIEADGAAQVVLGADGSLFYSQGASLGATSEAVWVGRDGTVTPVDSSWRFDPRLTGGPGWSLSPDGRRLAIGISTPDGDQIWVKELDRGPQSRLTFERSATTIRPRWRADGRTVSYLSERDSIQGIYTRRADGAGVEELLLSIDRPIWEAVWSRDAKWLVARTGGAEGSIGDRDIFVMELGVDSTLRPLLVSPADERAIALSPDGRWLAYESGESGEDQVFVRPFPDVNAGKWQISLGGGSAALWAHNGRELFYLSPDREMMVADIAVDQGFQVTNRRVLFRLGLEFNTAILYTPWDVSPDDQRFIMTRSVSTGRVAAQMILATNWLREVREKTNR